MGGREVIFSNAMLRSATVFLASLAMILLAAAPGAAKPGELDRDFGRNGKVIGGSSGSIESPAQTAVARDGSIVTAVSRGEGEYAPEVGWEKPVEIRRYLPDGRLDAAFGDGGTVTFRMPPSSPHRVFDFSDLIVDHSGRPLLFGQARGAETRKAEGLYSYSIYPSHATVIRLTTEGRLDSSFGGGDGIAMFDFEISASATYTPPATRASMGILDSRGRIEMVVALREQVPDDASRGSYRAIDRLLARVTPSGDLDQSFGGGDAIAPLGSIERVSGMSFGPDEKVTLAGHGAESVQLLRLDEEGIPDERFGNGGSRTYPGLYLSDIDVDPAGRTLLLGVRTPRVGRLDSPQRVVRLRRDGTLDRSFGARGSFVVRVRKLASLTSIATEPVGRILLAGSFPRPLRGRPRPRWPWKVGVLRLLESGRPDRTFAHRGRVLTGFGAGTSAPGVTDAIIDGRGRLLLAALVRLRGAPLSELRQGLLRYELR
jgi:uncharacterized delta-60 repeat protein